MLIFKLNSSKIFFYSGSCISVFVGGLAVFKERRGDNLISESEKLIAGHFVQFLAITVVLLLNLYFCAKLVEGIVFRLPYKILQWIIVNSVNIVQLAVYSFKIDTPLGYLTFIIFFYVWSAMIFLFYELHKGSSTETIAENQQQIAVEPTVAYVTFSNDNSNKET